MQNNTIQKLKNMLPEYLDMLGLPTKGTFRCLNPNHADKNPSMSFDAKDGQHVKCFSCGAFMDVFDLIAINELDAPVVDGPDGKPKAEYNFSEAYNKTLQILNVDGPKMKSEQNHAKNEQEIKAKVQLEQVNKEIIKRANTLLDPDKYSEIKAPNKYQKQAHTEGLQYLHRRGISEGLASEFNLGFASSWSSPTAAIRGHKVPGTPRLIIPTGPASYIARDARSDIPDNEQPYKKMKEGPVHIFNRDALEQNVPIFVVEGEIDALSIMETGQAMAIGLGSVANINIFMKAVYQVKQSRKNFYPTLLIALDNDEAGQRAVNMLTTQLNRARVTNYVVQVARGHKDVNEALVASRDQFTKDVARIVKDPADRLQGLLDYINNRSEVTAIPTGFKNLDNVLDGGLYEGLYGIGAISSLGKTTFALQIADHIAQYEKHPVLYFALEMGTYEMMTKSISRITFEHSDGDEKLAQGTRSLLKGKWKQRYNKAQYENVIRSFEEYGDYYSNIVIHDGSEQRPTIKDITQTVTSYVERTGRKPVVIIDYLQILKPMNDRATDKANVTTSINGMKKLATKFHIPVIVISSFNRLNYNYAVSMEAFKESGDIEYSTDVLIGLQLKGVGQDGFNVNEAKQKSPRDIEAVILKNRNGATGDTLNFAYYSMFNKFMDMDDIDDSEERTPMQVHTQVDDNGRIIHK